MWHVAAVGKGVTTQDSKEDGGCTIWYNEMQVTHKVSLKLVRIDCLLSMEVIYQLVCDLQDIWVVVIVVYGVT